MNKYKFLIVILIFKFFSFQFLSAGCPAWTNPAIPRSGNSEITALDQAVYSWKVGIYTTSFGAPLLFPAVAAVFFGASQLRGRPNVWGTVIAVYTLAFGIKGIGLRYPREISWLQPMFEGLTLLIAVAIASRQLIIKVQKRKVDKADLENEVDQT